MKTSTRIFNALARHLIAIVMIVLGVSSGESFFLLFGIILWPLFVYVLRKTLFPSKAVYLARVQKQMETDDNDEIVAEYRRKKAV